MELSVAENRRQPEATWTETPFRLPGAVQHTFTLGPDPTDGWSVFVAMPPPSLREVAGEGPYPTLYVLDASITFAVAAQVAQTILWLSSGQLRPVVVVGITPASDDHTRLINQRSRDLTPTSVVPPPVADSVAYGTGGAAAMLRLISEEIAPRLESIYPFDRLDRGLAGWSLGGLFTCWSLLQGRADFKRFLAVSPSLWWDDGLLLDEHRFPAADLGPADIYLAVGECERDLTTGWPAMDRAKAEAFSGIDMVAGMNGFVERLQRHGGVEVAAEVIPGEFHGTVWAAGVTRGLVQLYRTRREHAATPAA